MSQIRKVLQCRANGWSICKVNRRTGISRNTIRSYLRRVEELEVAIADLLKLEDIDLNELIGQDKPSVEASVRIVYQEIYADLRDQVFFNIDQLNAAIRPLLDKLNHKLMQGRDYSRRSRFEAQERQKLLQLPSDRFIVRKTARYKVQKNYHILLGEDRHYYSLPFRLVGKMVTVRYCFKVVEISMTICE